MSQMTIALSCLMSVAVTRSVEEKSLDFGALRAFLDSTTARTALGNLSLTVGDAQGMKFAYSNQEMGPDIVLGLASGSKWPAVTALASRGVPRVLLPTYGPGWTSDRSREPGRLFPQVRRESRRADERVLGLVGDGRERRPIVRDASSRVVRGPRLEGSI